MLLLTPQEKDGFGLGCLIVYQVVNLAYRCESFLPCFSWYYFIVILCRQAFGEGCDVGYGYLVVRYLVVPGAWHYNSTITGEGCGWVGGEVV